MTTNTIDNTPKHCHGCHAFADCPQASNMNANTEPVEGWVQDGDVYCTDCMELPVPDDYPYEGESDSPTHCGGCGVPIIHDLTTDGVEYVRELLADGNGCCQEVWRTVWADYDVQPKIPVDSIVVPGRFVELCEGWAGGMDCMLRAVESTGNLTIGTIRPRGCDCDEQHYYSIFLDLSSDVGHARKLASVAHADYDALSEFEDWADEQCDRLCESYGLEDWDR
jgi:hypothetical protein